jgi:phage FluMu protein Com
MVERTEGTETVDVVCPHCKKSFQPKLIGSGAGERYRGFKCPHCKLFVPAGRTVGDESVRA